MSMPTVAKRTAAVLTTSDYLGTLAATRCLGRHGVPVIVAGSSVLGPAQWSRSASRVVRCPKPVDPDAVLAWLLDFGAREPGAVLHPTSDEMAWLISRYAHRLRDVFHLYAPSFDAIRTLLDKSRLDRACVAVGIERPETFFPRDENEAAELGASGRAFVIKPRAQVFYTSHMKGDLVSGREEVMRAWRACRSSQHAASVRADAPDIDKPLVQVFDPAAREGVYSIAGFVSRDYEVLAARASRKILQRPAGVGVGICFEGAPVVPELVAKLGALARHVGFFGAFEAEFVGDGAHRLIDFNPRYYGQMGFDIARGAPLPWMLHLGALGRDEVLRTQASDAIVEGAPRVYEDFMTLRLMLASRRIAGTLPAERQKKWKLWREAHGADVMDATLATDDPLPAVASAVSTLWGAARHPRGFWRSLMHGTV